MEDDKNEDIDEKYDLYNFMLEDGPYDEEEEEPDWMEHLRDLRRNLI